MGIQLTNVAVARWAQHCSGRAFRVLVRMASTALDTPSGKTPAAMYFGGMELLTMTMQSGTSDRTVYRALQELVQIGAIESVQHGHRGRQAVYRLTLDNDPKPVGKPVNSESNGEGKPDSSVTNDCQGWQAMDGKPDSLGPNACHLVSGLGTRGTTKDDERLDDEVVPFPTELQTAREDDRSEDDLSDEDEHARFAACPHCNAYLDPDGSCFVCRRRSQMEAS